MPTSTNYFEFVIDPSTGNQIEVRDKYAREQLVHKTEKTVVNSLPAKPTTYDAWLAMERFIYFVPIDGEENQYEAWTLFFIGDPTVPADYTDTDNYEWVQIAVTDTDLTNFSTKGHTHEVIPETEVEDHDYTPQGAVTAEFTGSEGTSSSNTHSHTITPQGSVSSSFTGTQGTTSDDTHSHTFTPSGDVSGSFSGSQGTTENGTTGITISKTTKKLSTKKLSVAPATSVNFTGSTTNAQRATGALETLSSYDASKAVFNGIDVTDGVLSFVTKKMTTADTVSGLSGTIDASKVTVDGSGTVTNQDMATGALETDASAQNQVMTDASLADTGHTHTFTPSGSVSASFTGTEGTTSSDTHNHTLTPQGSVSSTFSGTQGTTSEVTHSHTLTPNGTVAAEFSGLKTYLKHKVDNKKVRTSPDSEDEGSHAYDWYGILFDEDEDDPQKTRVGNMDMHRMLPIQTKMRRCLLNDDGTVNYYLDDRDSTKKAGSQEGWVTSEETFMSKIESDDVRGDVEYLNAVKGHSIVWNQLVKNGNFASSNYWNGGTVVDNVYTCTKEATGSETIKDAIQQMLYVDNRKYLFLATVKSNNEYTKISLLPTGVSTDGQTVYTVYSEWTNLYYFWARTGTGLNLQIRGYNQGYPNNDISFSIKNVMCFDLTLIFGAGNEPATVEAFESWLSKNVGLKDYYNYNAGTILNAKPERLISTGRNLLNPTTGEAYLKTYDWEDNDNTYEIIGTYTGLSFTDMSGNTTTPVPDANGKFVIPADGVLTVTATDLSQVCVQAVWDETYDGEFVEFEQNQIDIDVTKIYGQLNGAGDYVQVYPNGMLSVDSVKDMLTKDSAIINVKQVNAGTLEWELVSNRVHTFRAAITDKRLAPTGDGDSLLLCSDYVTTVRKSTPTADTEDKIICELKSLTDWTKYIIISDSAYSAAPTALNNWVDGVIVNYVLETPLTYTNLVYRDNGVDTPLVEKFFPNGIVVGKGGTVEIQPQNTEEIVTCAPTLTMKKYVLQAGATLNGADGQVMVEIPEHWRKVYTYLDGAKTMVKAMVSPYPQTTTGWIHVKKGYISAYEANIDANNKLCSTSDIKDLVLSVVNGKVNATCDVSVIGETGAPADWAAYIAGTHSLFPTTSVNMATLRTDARARHSIDGDPDTRWNMLVYEQYLALYWLYVIEYANLNSQAAVNVALDYDGFHQGGLGDGVTTVGGTAWDNFNAYKPFVPCGITNCLGNHSGEVILTLPSAFGTNIKVAVNSYRGVEMPFGHIFKFADGIKYLGDGTQQAVLRCSNPANYSSASNSDNYTSIGNNIGSDGYKTKIMIGDDGDINCKAVGGGALKAYCDYNYQAHTNGTYYCCLLGGRADIGARAGLACVSSPYSVSNASAYIGSRLCFIDV